MKYCDECANKYSFPLTPHMSDSQRCELCGKIRDCNETPVPDLIPFLSPLIKRINNADKDAEMFVAFLCACPPEGREEIRKILDIE